jgi:hypothetical protein
MIPGSPFEKKSLWRVQLSIDQRGIYTGRRFKPPSPLPSDFFWRRQMSLPHPKVCSKGLNVILLNQLNLLLVLIIIISQVVQFPLLYCHFVFFYSYYHFCQDKEWSVNAGEGHKASYCYMKPQYGLARLSS